MFDNELPCLPIYKVQSDVEFCFEKKEVYFVLSHGCNDVVGAIKCKEVVKKFDVLPESGNPEHARECYFKFLQLTENVVTIDGSNIDLVAGQKIELTETQYNELNEYLKEEMELV